MDGLIRLPNAIWWVQFRLTGGRKVLYRAGLYAMGLVSCLMSATWLFPDPTFRELVTAGIKILTALQCGMLLFVGCSAVHKAVNRDYTTKMLESNRLAPMTGRSVVLGYILGGASQPILLWLIGVLFGGAVLRIAGLPITPWLAGNLLLMSTAAMLWGATVFLGVGDSKPVNPVGLLVVGAMMGWMIVMAMPGLGFVFGAYSIVASWHAMTGGFVMEGPATAVTKSGSLTSTSISLLIVLNMAMTLIWATAASNRYRRPDRAGLILPLAIIFLIAWTLACGGGIPLFEKFGVGDVIGNGSKNMPQLQFISALALSMLCSILPISVTCIDWARRVKGTYVRSWTERVPSRLMVLLGTIIVCSILGLVDVQWQTGEKIEDVEVMFATRFSQDTMARWATTAVVIFSSLLAIDGYLRILYLRKARAGGNVAGLVFLVWLLPPLLDYLVSLFWHANQSESLATARPSFIFGCSPFVTLVGTWDLLKDLSLMPGLVFQVLFALGMTALAIKAERRERRRRSDMVAPVARSPNPSAS